MRAGARGRDPHMWVVIKAAVGLLHLDLCVSSKTMRSGLQAVGLV